MAPTTRSASKKQPVESQLKSPIKKTSKAKNKNMHVVKTGSQNLTWFIKVYKGLDDWHIPIFKEAQKFTSAKHVLYPGSDKHITASLFFPGVVYVDFNKKLIPFYKDEKVLDWVKQNKTYTEESIIKFLSKNFSQKFEELNSFDLMISACAGIVSKDCAKYLKVGGHFLVSDDHSDARAAYLMPEFEFVAVYDSAKQELDSSEEGKTGHFITTEGTPITKSQLEESTQKPRSKLSFKLQKQETFYLFKKIK